jgi:hypothetical protein
MAIGRTKRAISAIGILLGGLVFPVIFSCFASGPAAERLRLEAPGTLPEYSSILTQLHAHALSNHNEPQAASMELMVREAKRTGYDVLWLTDHPEILNIANLKIGFRGSSVSPDYHSIDLVRNARPDWFPSQAAIVWVNSSPTIAVNDDTLEILAFSIDSSAPSSVDVRIVSKAGDSLVHAWEFARPLLSDVTMCIPLGVVNPGPLTAGLLTVRLGYHPTVDGEGHYAALRYVLGPGVFDSTGVTTISAGLLGSVVTRKCFPLTLDAKQIEGGTDNTVSDIILSFRNLGTDTRIYVGPIELTSGVRDSRANWARLRALADSLQNLYRLRVLLGSEIVPTLAHLNGFIADQSADVVEALSSYAGGLTGYAGRVHAKGGLVSLNHPFGLSHVLDETTPARLGAVVDSLLALKAWNADLLEVGFLKRGGASLSLHLILWDRLGLSGLPLCGVAGNDSHGGVWSDSMPYTPFATWIWADTIAPAALLNALRNCRAYIGVPYSRKVDIDLVAMPVRLSTSDASIWGDKLARMGDRNVPPGVWRVGARVRGAPSNYTVLIHRAHLEANEVAYETFRGPINEAHDVDVQAGDLIRAEVHGVGEFQTFLSNPIWFRSNTQ